MTVPDNPGYQRDRRVAASRQLILEQIPEKTFQADAVGEAERHGWWTYHPYDSRRSTPGWVDLTLIRPPRIIFAELKSQRGAVRKSQRHVLDLLAECPGVETYLWRPSDFDQIVGILR